MDRQSINLIQKSGPVIVKADLYHGLHEGYKSSVDKIKDAHPVAQCHFLFNVKPDITERDELSNLKPGALGDYRFEHYFGDEWALETNNSWYVSAADGSDIFNDKEQTRVYLDIEINPNKKDPLKELADQVTDFFTKIREESDITELFDLTNDETTKAIQNIPYRILGCHWQP